MQRVCLVTGASRGIGAAIADALGAAGATVVGTATTEAGAAAISERFAAKGIAGAGMALDVGSPTAVDELIARVTAPRWCWSTTRASRRTTSCCG